MNGSIDAIRYTATWQSTSAAAANTPLTIFSPASNVNGAYLWSASINSGHGAANNCALIARNAAPASVSDGAIILMPDNYSGSVSTAGAYSGRLNRPVYIPPGLGLYFLASVADSGGGFPKTAMYTLL